jgi:hypothetical protein
MGGFSPAIGMFGGGELGGEGVRTGETGTELPGGKGKSGGFKEKATGLESAKASLSALVATVIRGGMVKLGVGESSVVLCLGQGTISWERGVTRISPSNPRPGGENSTGTLPKFKVLETPAEGMTGK